MAENSPKGWKTLWEGEKLLVTSNISFFHSVFKGPVMEIRKNQGLFGKRLRKMLIKMRKSCISEYVSFQLMFSAHSKGYK